MTNLLDLPTDILGEIIKQADVVAATMISMTCRAAPPAKKISTRVLVKHGYLHLIGARSRVYSTAQLAAEYGQVEIFKWASSNCNSHTFDQCAKTAAAHGHWNIVALADLHTNVEWDKIYRIAASHDQIDFLKRRHSGLPADICDHARSPQMFEYLLSCGYSWTEYGYMIAARDGRVDLLKTVPAEQILPGVLSEAIRNSQLEVVKYLRSVGIPWPNNTFSRAIRKNISTDILEYAFAEGCPLESNLYSCAADRDDISFIKWLHSKGYSWTNSDDPALPCAYAASRCDLEMLTWLHDHGCPWDNRVYTYTITSSRGTRARVHHDWFSVIARNNIIKYALFGRCMSEPKTTKMIMHNCSAHLLFLALRHGCPANELYAEAVKSGRRDVVTYLHENGYPWDAGLYKIATAHDRAYMIKHLDKLGYHE